LSEDDFKFFLIQNFLKCSYKLILCPTKLNFHFAQIIKNTKKYNKFFI